MVLQGYFTLFIATESGHVFEFTIGDHGIPVVIEHLDFYQFAVV